MKILKYLSLSVILAVSLSACKKEQDVAPGVCTNTGIIAAYQASSDQNLLAYANGSALMIYQGNTLNGVGWCAATMGSNPQVMVSGTVTYNSNGASDAAAKIRAYLTDCKCGI